MGKQPMGIIGDELLGRKISLSYLLHLFTSMEWILVHHECEIQEGILQAEHKDIHHIPISGGFHADFLENLAVLLT